MTTQDTQRLQDEQKGQLLDLIEALKLDIAEDRVIGLLAVVTRKNAEWPGYINGGSHHPAALGLCQRMVVELAMDLMKKRPLLKFCDTEQVMRSDAGGAS